MIATWLRPAKAPLFAWLAALAYIVTPIVGGLFLFGPNPLSQIDPHFFYSVAIRIAAALALTLLSVRLAARANYSLKRTAAGQLR